MKQISEGYKNINVEILDYDKHPAKRVFDMLKQTWIALQDIEYDEQNPIVTQFITDALAYRLNPTVFDTVTMTVLFKNISRINLAQLTRHRGWLFNSESQMPQHVKHNVVLPLNILDSKLGDKAKALIAQCQELYDELCDAGIPWQDARYLLLHGQTCNISAYMTLPQLVNVSGQRLENNTADEINYAFRKLLYVLKTTISLDTDMDNLDKLIWNTKLAACDAFGANQKKSFCTDTVFGNACKRYPDANKYVTDATTHATADFTKSAWYAELIRIYYEEPYLLLPDEKDMIERWLSKNNSDTITGQKNDASAN